MNEYLNGKIAENGKDYYDGNLIIEFWNLNWKRKGKNYNIW